MGRVALAIVLATVGCSTFGTAPSSSTDGGTTVADGGPISQNDAGGPDVVTRLPDGGLRWCQLPEQILAAWTVCSDFDGDEPLGQGFSNVRQVMGGELTKENGKLVATLPANGLEPKAYLNMEVEASKKLELEFDLSVEVMGSVANKPGHAAIFFQTPYLFQLYLRVGETLVQTYDSTPGGGGAVASRLADVTLVIGQSCHIRMVHDTTSFRVSINGGVETDNNIPLDPMRSSEVNVGL